MSVRRQLDQILIDAETAVALNSFLRRQACMAYFPQAIYHHYARIEDAV